MKITLNIPSLLMKNAEAVARRDGTTVQALVERGLRLALAECRDRKKFRLRDAAVGGLGLQADARGMTWEQIRNLSHEANHWLPGQSRQ
jgi:hypothetical protein